jgi:hypothetical protein
MRLYYKAYSFEPLTQLMLEQMRIASQMSYRGRVACVNVSNMWSDQNIPYVARIIRRRAAIAQTKGSF